MEDQGASTIIKREIETNGITEETNITLEKNSEVKQEDQLLFNPEIIIKIEPIDPMLSPQCKEEIKIKEEIEEPIQVFVKEEDNSNRQEGNVTDQTNFFKQETLPIEFEKTSFTCNTCHVCFQSEDQLKIHQKIHETHKEVKHKVKIPCKICGKLYAPLGMGTHMKVHTTPSNIDRSPTCHICDKSFSSYPRKVSHMKTHTNLKPFVCDICNKSFALAHTLTVHKRVHTGEKPYKCNLCDKAFAQQFTYNCHKLLHEQKYPFTCDYCNKSFIAKFKLKLHIMCHHTKVLSYPCTECDKKFTSKTSLTTHMRIHTGERPFQCGRCDKGFVSNSQLTDHTKTHLQIKNYVCNVCQQAFSSSSNLLRHTRCVHLKEKPAPVYHCNKCNIPFETKALKTQHVKDFHSEFKCTICGIIIKHKYSLKEHMLRKHSDDKSYSCNICEKKFSVISGLKAHNSRYGQDCQKIIEKDRPYSCTLCDKTYCQKFNLTHHIKTFHIKKECD